jgi:acetyltransferase-like isoleucine patch superfamily enzyme|tara:strand:- start:203 stop:835 length:633 start_codon:yes stop_codon:yes gene_type:complete
MVIFKELVCLIDSLLMRMRNSYYWRINRIKFTVNNILYGDNLIVKGPIYLTISPTSQVKIGNGCTIKSGHNYNPLSRNIRTSITLEENAKLQIGNNVGLSSVCLWVHHSVIIGDNVNVGADTIIMDSDAHSLNYAHRRSVKIDLQNKINKEIIIGDDVLIGTRAIILKGVTIGERSVIGSGSVVTKDVPPDTVFGGNPAMFIKNLDLRNL